MPSKQLLFAYLQRCFIGFLVFYTADIVLAQTHLQPHILSLLYYDPNAKQQNVLIEV